MQWAVCLLSLPKNRDDLMVLTSSMPTGNRAYAWEWRMNKYLTPLSQSASCSHWIIPILIPLEENVSDFDFLIFWFVSIHWQMWGNKEKWPNYLSFWNNELTWQPQISFTVKLAVSKGEWFDHFCLFSHFCQWK